MLLRDITKELIISAVSFNEELQRKDSFNGDNTYLIFEFLCAVSTNCLYIYQHRAFADLAPAQCDPVGAPISSCAWPRPAGAQHILLFGPGCPSTAGSEAENFVRDAAIEAPSKIVGKTQDVCIIPNTRENFHDPKMVCFTPHYYELFCLL